MALIILNLQCDQGHRFEGWFASRVAFDEQAARNEVGCPLCQSLRIVALPAALRVLRNASAPAAIPKPDAGQAAVAQLFQALTALARKAENVGDRFPEEARRIHYEEVAARSIRGQATHEEAMELLDEGIMVLPVLVPPDNETH
jgi:hypothetical protein